MKDTAGPEQTRESTAEKGPVSFAGRNEWWLAPVGAFFFSRLLLVLAVSVGAHVWPFTFGPGEWNVPEAPVCIDGFCRWDAGWYRSIVNDGYFYTESGYSSVAFFPLYPVSAKAVLSTGLISKEHAIELLLLLSNLYFLGALLLVYQLALALAKAKPTARATVFLIAFQPVALFFSAPYTESLFLLLASGTLLAACGKRWALAGILGLFCSATRNLGVFLAPAVGLMWLSANGISWRVFINRDARHKCLQTLCHNFSWLWVLLIPMGLFAFMIYLHLHFGNALAFVDVQKEWGHKVSGFWIILYKNGIAIMTGQGGWRSGMDLFSALLFILLGVLSWKKFGAGIGVFCLACVLIPLSATTVSMVRYVSVITPAFVVLAGLLLKYRLLKYVLVLFSISAAWLVILYSHWIFVG